MRSGLSRSGKTLEADNASGGAQADNGGIPISLQRFWAESGNGEVGREPVGVNLLGDAPAMAKVGRGILFDPKTAKETAMRERKEHRVEMVQMDGSQYDWFEERGERCVLMALIDDASGEVFARFFPYEGTWLAMEVFRRYLESYGIPMAVYLDRHGVY